MPIPRLLAAIVALVLGGSIRPVAAADIAAWVYDFPRWSGNQYEARMPTLPPGIRHLYASLEDGPRFLLDDELRAADIQRLVGALRERFGIATHAMILQDTRWLDDPGGARERLGRVLALNRFSPDRAFAGVHVDVEPHSLEDWECGDLPARRGLVQDGAGQPVAGARVKVGERQIATSRCGRFVFRDLPSSRVELEVGGIGLQSLTVPVTGLTPGRELEMAPIVVGRRP